MACKCSLECFGMSLKRWRDLVCEYGGHAVDFASAFVVTERKDPRLCYQDKGVRRFVSFVQILRLYSVRYRLVFYSHHDHVRGL